MSDQGCYFLHGRNFLQALRPRLYERDESVDTLVSCLDLVRRHDPSVIVLLGPVSAPCLRAWLHCAPRANIHVVVPDLQPLWDTLRYFPMDISRVTFREQDILTLDFSVLWTDNDRVLLFVGAHHPSGVPIMAHVLRNALPPLTQGSVVVVDGLWHSPNRLANATSQQFFDNVLLPEIDELQCITCHYGPYHDGGSFMGFLYAAPLLDFVNSRYICLNFEPGSKHVWFAWDGDTHAATHPQTLVPRNDAECGEVEYNPLRIDSHHPLVRRVLGTAEQLYRQGNVRDVIPLLNDLLTKNPCPAVCLALAICLARLGALIDAYHLASAAQKMDATNTRIERLLSDLAQRLGVGGMPKTSKQGLTLFAIPKPFTGHTAIIQTNAIHSWARLTPRPEIILFGDEPGIAEIAHEIGARHVAEIARNEFGTPLVDDLFHAAARLAENDILAYVNADIILFDDFMAGVAKAAAAHEEFLLVGRRWDLNVTEEIDFSNPDWQKNLRDAVASDGFLHAETGIDYFVHTKGLWPGMPPFALGRCAWDNWLMKWPIALGKTAIDASEYITAVHQDHGYAHAGGRANAFSGIEPKRNRAMAGSVLGWTTDAPFCLTAEGKIERRTPLPASFSSPEVKAARVRWLIVQAGKMMQQRWPDLAEAKYEEATQLQPENARIHELLLAARASHGETL